MKAYLLNINYANSDFIKKEVEGVGVDKEVIELFANKFINYTIKITDLKSPWANILKQEALSLGADFAVSKETYRCKSEFTDGILQLTKQQYLKLLDKLQHQGFMTELIDNLKNIIPKPYTLKIKDKEYNLKDNIVIFGILNITPDSFSDGGLYNSIDKAKFRIEEMINNGVDVIDVGGESTRPGAKLISAQEELDRIMPIIEFIKTNTDALLSVDTHKLTVAKSVMPYIDVLNDLSSGKNTLSLIHDIEKHNITPLVMYNKSVNITGTADFNDTKDPLLDFQDFAINIKNKLQYPTERVIFDPGFGFSWSLNDTKYLLQKAFAFNSFPFHTLFGISRKSFFQKHLGIKLENRDTATSILTAKLIEKGIRIFRTHKITAGILAKKLALFY